LTQRGELASGLSDAQREEVAASWAKSGLYEHASVASFGKFMMELLAYGAPSELVQGAAQAIQDEIAHARLCFGVASAYAGVEVGPGALDIAGSVTQRPSPERMLRALIEQGCVGETLSTYVARAQAGWIEDEQVRDAMLALADEEGQHAELAWRCAAWLIASYPELAEVAREAFEAELGRYGAASARPLSEAQQVLLAHGVLPEAMEHELRCVAAREVVAPAARALWAATLRVHEASQVELG
jgi:hypothetical protein